MNIEWEQQAQRIFPNPAKAGVRKGPDVDLRNAVCMEEDTEKRSSYMG